MQTSKRSSTSKNLSASQGMSYEDFMVLFFISAFLIIDFFPYFDALEIIAPQFLYLACLNVVIGGYIYGNANLHTKALVNIFKASLLFKLYLAFIGLCFISMLFAVNFTLSVLAISEILIVFSMFLNFSILLHGRLHLLLKICFLVGLSALFQSGKVLHEFNTMASTKSLADAFSSNILKGNTGNINILAASLMVKVPFILFAIVHLFKWKRLVLSLALGLSISTILLINARATLLSLVILLLLFLVFYLRSKLTKLAILRLAFVIVPLVTSYIVVNNVFKEAALNDRFTSTLDRFKAVNTQDRSSGRRMQIWKGAIGVIKDNPIVGVGIGNYRVESIPYDMTVSGTIPLNAHNDFLEIASETGILNGIVYFALFATLLWLNLKRWLDSKNQEIKNVAFVSLMLLVVYGMDVLVNFPLYRPTMIIAFCFIMAFTFVNIGNEENEKIENGKTFSLIAIAIALIPIFVAYQAYKASVLERDIQTDDVNVKDKGMLTGDDVLKRMPLLPNVFNTSESFAEYAGIYFLREKNYQKALQLLDEGNRINPYLGRPDFYKALIARDRGDLDSAYIYTKKAFYRRPVNTTFYTSGLMYAVVRKDTAEIDKFYNAYIANIKDPIIWEQAYVSFKNAGASEQKLNSFKDLGNRTFPQDTIVSKAINASTITALIVEAQALTDQGKLKEALAKYNSGLALEPNNIYINQNLGFYYFNLMDYKKASQFFLKSLEVPGLNGGKTEFYLSLSFFNTRQNEMGCKYASIAKEKGFPNSEILFTQYKCK